MKNTRIAAVVLCAALAVCVLSNLAVAQDDEMVQPVNTGNISLEAGATVSTHYFFRGILQEDQGVIVQPWVDLGFQLYENPDSDTLNSVTLNVGIWNSFHDNQTGNDGNGPSSWYEADLYAGVTIGIIENVEGSVVYTAYTSPNDAFSTVQEIAVGLAYDDSALWEDSGLPGFTGLQPSITVAFETDNTAFGPDEGVFLGLSVEPGIDLIEDKLTLSVPVNVGFSLDDYYEVPGDDDAFGYADIGVFLGFPLEFIPEGFGEWSASAGAQLVFLDSNLEDANNDDDLEVVGTFNVGMAY